MLGCLEIMVGILIVLHSAKNHMACLAVVFLPASPSRMPAAVFLAACQRDKERERGEKSIVFC